MKFNRKLLILFIIVVALIPGACAESLSFGGGTSVAVSKESSVEGGLTANDASIQSSVSSTGVIEELNIDPWVENTKGDHAEIGVTGTNVAGFSYRDNYHPGKGSGWASDAVWVEQWLGAISADSLQAHSYATNAAGDEANAEITISSGSLNGYYNASYAGPALWLGFDRGAFVQQIAGYAKGAHINVQTRTNNAPGDEAISITDVTNGALNGYSARANAVRYEDGLIAAGVSLDSLSASAHGGSITQAMHSYDNKGDISGVATSIANGDLVANSFAYSISQWGLAEANQKVNAKGFLIDVAAYAQNNKPGYEYLTDGYYTIYITAPTGKAEFRYNAANDQIININSRATTTNLLISPALPIGTQTAIMLEPMNYAFSSIGGATDLSTTVLASLLAKDYAVLRYTDSGASSDKFQKLGNYNVVLVNSHMNSNEIGLSTGLGYIPASQLNYHTSKNSLVILAGCESFAGYPQKSALATAISEADLSGGYANSVSTLWNNDYLSYFFNALSNGDTAKAANIYANTLATYKYGGSPYNLKLVFYGDENFHL